MAAKPSSFLSRIFGGVEETLPTPLSPAERKDLEHQKRRLERQLRRLEKALDRRGCSTCVKAEDPIGVRLDKERRALAGEVDAIEARLRVGA